MTPSFSRSRALLVMALLCLPVVTVFGGSVATTPQRHAQVRAVPVTTAPPTLAPRSNALLPLAKDGGVPGDEAPQMFPFAPERLALDRRLKPLDLRSTRPDPAVVETLRQRSERAPVRVVITLAQVFSPEGLLGEAGALRQREQIARDQQRLLAALEQARPQPRAGAGAARAPWRERQRMRYSPRLSMEVDTATLDWLAQQPGVARIEPVALLKPALGVSVPLIGAADAQDRGVDGDGWVVAVLDTGIERDHPYLRGAVGEACFTSNTCPNGGDRQFGPGAAQACGFAAGCDHGTHVSGIAIGAVPLDETGNEGVARGANLMPVSVFSRLTGGDCAGDEDGLPAEDPCVRAFGDDIEAGLEHVYAQRGNFRIAAVNLSLGSGGVTQTCDGEGLKLIIDQLRAAGIATVVAAGNDGFINAASFPACISSTIAVGATDAADRVASFSNIAPFVDVLAPGAGITAPCFRSVFPGGQCSKSGTSMAAPHVAGAIALMKQRSNDPVNLIEALLESTGRAVRDRRVSNGLTLPRIDALKASNLHRPQLLADAVRNLREPRPHAHTFQFFPNRNFWSAVAVRPQRNQDLNLAVSEDADGVALRSSAGERGLIDIVALDNNLGRRPVNQLDHAVVNLSGANAAGGRYEIEWSNAGQVLDRFGIVSFSDTDVLRMLDTFTPAISIQYLRAVPSAGQDIELLVFDSFAGDAASFVRGRGDAQIASANGAGGAESLSFFSADDDYKGVAILNRSGRGSVAVYRDSTPPTGSVVIDGGAALTQDRRVDLDINLADPEVGIAEMRVSFDGAFDSENWEPYVTRKSGDLRQLQGTVTVRVQVRNNAGIEATFADTIEADIPPIRISIPTQQYAEGQGNAVTRTRIPVILSEPSPDFLFVPVSFVDGSAVRGDSGDYDPRGLTSVSFQVGESIAWLTPPIIGDDQVEGDEQFFIELGQPSSSIYAVATPRVPVIIIDDETAPTLSVGDATEIEGPDDGGAQMFLEVRLSRQAAAAITVDYAVLGGSAELGSDVLAASGTLRFEAGETLRRVLVNVVGDFRVEADESFTLQLSNAVGATLARDSGFGTILNDDRRASVSVQPAEVVEGSAGEGRSLRFRVQLSEPSTIGSVTVTLSTLDGSAVAGEDYTATRRTLIFSESETVKVFAVPVLGDALAEAAESMFVQVDEALLADIEVGQAAGGIADDDEGASGVPVVRALGIPVNLDEGNGGQRPVMRFAFELSKPQAEVVSFDYRTRDFDDDPREARAGSDYLATSGTLRFEPGQTQGVVEVTLLGDDVLEGYETFLLELENPVGVELLPPQVGGGIVNDDPELAQVSIRGGSGREGTADAGGLVPFTVQLSRPVASEVRVQVFTRDGTALAGSDYRAATATLVFGPGEVSRDFRIRLLGDALAEPEERFELALRRPVGVVIDPASDAASGIIQDDDGPAAIPRLSVRDVQVVEGAADGRQVLRFVVAVRPVSDQPVSVDLLTESGTALAGSDFVARNETLSIAAGLDRKVFNVRIRGDALAEGNETLLLRLSSPVNATIVDAEAVGTIVDDD